MINLCTAFHWRLELKSYVFRILQSQKTAGDSNTFLEIISLFLAQTFLMSDLFIS